MGIDNIWVFAQAADGAPTTGTLELLTKARSLGGTVSAFIAGDGAGVAAALGAAFPHEPAEGFVPEEIVKNKAARFPSLVPDRVDRRDPSHMSDLESSTTFRTAIDDEGNLDGVFRDIRLQCDQPDRLLGREVRRGLGWLLGVCFVREAPERAIGSGRRAGKWGLRGKRGRKRCFGAPVGGVSVRKIPSPPR